MRSSIGVSDLALLVSVTVLVLVTVLVSVLGLVFGSLDSVGLALELVLWLGLVAGSVFGSVLVSMLVFVGWLCSIFALISLFSFSFVSGSSFFSVEKASDNFLLSGSSISSSLTCDHSYSSKSYLLKVSATMLVELLTYCNSGLYSSRIKCHQIK